MTMTVTYLAFAKAPVFFIKLITRLTVRTLSVFGFALSAITTHVTDPTAAETRSGESVCIGTPQSLSINQGWVGRLCCSWLFPGNVTCFLFCCLFLNAKRFPIVARKLQK